MPLIGLKIQNSLKEKEKELNEVKIQLENIEERSKELLNQYSEVSETADSATLKELIENDEALEDEKKIMQERKSEIQAEILSLRAKLSTMPKGEKALAPLVPKNEELDVRSAFNEYLHTRKESIANDIRALGFTSDDGDPIIPTEIVYQPRDEVFTDYDLRNYINVVSVSTPSGTYPILNRTSERMHTVEELKENPKLANPTFNNVTFQVATYRGYIPISQEAIDDAAVDLIGLIARHINTIVINTTNSKIAPIFQGFKPVTARTVDDIKEILNVKLDPAYNPSFFMTQSMYNRIDTLKDKNGHYLFQNDITSPSGKSLFGHSVVVIRDSLLGLYAGHMAAFVGDAKAAITLFDRKQISAKWIDDTVYGQMIQAGFRADFRESDPDAGYFVTFAPPEDDFVLTLGKETKPETVEGVSVTWTVKNNTAIAVYEGLDDKYTPVMQIMMGKAIVALSPGHIESETKNNQVTVTFGPEAPTGSYTLNAKVKSKEDSTYKVISQQPVEVKMKSEEAAAAIAQQKGHVVISNS